MSEDEERTMIKCLHNVVKLDNYVKLDKIILIDKIMSFGRLQI